MPPDARRSGAAPQTRRAMPRGAIACLCTALVAALVVAHRAAHATRSTVRGQLQRPLPTDLSSTIVEAASDEQQPRALSVVTTTRPERPLGEERRARLAADFYAARVVQRQMAVFDHECGCTKLILKEQAERHRTLARVTVLDGSHFRWEGLGNSGVRWMGLMRWALSTGRATFLRLTQDCSRANRREAHSPSSGRPSDATCHLDPGEYFTGWGGVDWRWGAATERRVARRMAARSESELLLQYAGYHPNPPAPISPTPASSTASACSFLA